MSEPLLRVRDLSKTFSGGSRRVLAVSDVSFDLPHGETLGLVGASGSGKSTLARLVLRLVAPDAGSVHFQGHDWLALRGARLRQARANMQMVFQDPASAFNPRATVESALADALRIHTVVASTGRDGEIGGLLEKVGLSPALRLRRVSALSGGQRQRLAIARALATRPKLIVLDEALSALDLATRRQILDLLVSLQRSDGIGYLFISHDLAVVRAIAHRIVVMDAGHVVEHGDTDAVIDNPQTSITRALIAAVPRLIVQAG